MDWFSKIGDFLQNPKKIIFTLLIISIAILQLGEENLLFFKLEGFLKEYGKYIGIAALASGAYIIVEILLYIKELILQKIVKFKKNKEQKEELVKFKINIKNKISNLDKYEKSVLREFYIQGKNTLKIPMDDPHIAGLLKDKILSIISNEGERNMVGLIINMQINSYAKDYLTNEILDYPDKPTKQEISELKKNRPFFATNTGW